MTSTTAATAANTSGAITEAAVIGVIGTLIGVLLTRWVNRKSINAAHAAAAGATKSGDAATESAKAATFGNIVAQSGVDVARLGVAAANRNADAATDSAGAAKVAAGAATKSAEAADKAAIASNRSARAAETAAAQLDVWRQREESMRMLRWAMDNSVSKEPNRSKAGQLTLEALRSSSTLLQPIDQEFFDTVLEGLLIALVEELGPEDEVYEEDDAGDDDKSDVGG